MINQPDQRAPGVALRTRITVRAVPEATQEHCERRQTDSLDLELQRHDLAHATWQTVAIERDPRNSKPQLAVSSLAGMMIAVGQASQAAGSAGLATFCVPALMIVARAKPHPGFILAICYVTTTAGRLRAGDGSRVPAQLLFLRDGTTDP